MKINLDDLITCECGCVFDYTVAGKLIDHYYGTYKGKCPCCKKEFCESEQ